MKYAVSNSYVVKRISNGMRIGTTTFYDAESAQEFADMLNFEAAETEKETLEAIHAGNLNPLHQPDDDIPF